MDTYITRHLGGSFEIPKHISRSAMLDIIKAPSPHFLAEMLHSERMDKESGKDVGAGLLSSLKHVAKRGLEGSKKFTKGALSVGRSLNTLLQKGILIAQALEPIVGIIDPSFKTLLDAGLVQAQAIQLGLGVAVEGGETIHSLLHGDVHGALNNLGKLGISEASTKKITQTAEDLQNILATVDVQQAGQAINQEASIISNIAVQPQVSTQLGSPADANLALLQQIALRGQ